MRVERPLTHFFHQLIRPTQRGNIFAPFQSVVLNWQLPVLCTLFPRAIPDPLLYAFEGEYISVVYDEGTDRITFDKKFYYGTLGWNVREPLFLYASYWKTEEYNTELIENDFLKFLIDVEVVTGGLSYNLSDRIALKGQLAIVKINSDLPPSLFSGADFEVYSLAISIFF